jgi:hypothetical protein
MDSQSKREYVTLVSKDDYEFFLEKEMANQSEEIAKVLKITPYEGKHKRVRLNSVKGNVLEVIIQYLHFKAKHDKPGFEKLNLKFDIDPDIALEVLKAGTDLRI